MNIIRPSVTLLYATPAHLITHAGRHSYQSHDKASEQSDAQLTAHFVKQNESPLEHSFAMFDVTCSYAAHVHFIRHRVGFHQSWLSQRYTEGLGFIAPPGVTDEAHLQALTDAFSAATLAYDTLRETGLLKQAARYVMPQATAMRGSISGNARAWLNMLNLRTSKKAMPETRLVAQMMRDELGKVWPTVFPGGK